MKLEKNPALKVIVLYTELESISPCWHEEKSSTQRILPIYIILLDMQETCMYDTSAPCVLYFVPSLS